MTSFSHDAPTTPLRQRMQEDMVMRGLGSHTQRDYIRHVRRFATFLGRSPATATVEDVRRFQLHLTGHEAVEYVLVPCDKAGNTVPHRVPENPGAWTLRSVRKTDRYRTDFVVCSHPISHAI